MYCETICDGQIVNPKRPQPTRRGNRGTWQVRTGFSTRGIGPKFGILGGGRGCPLGLLFGHRDDSEFCNHITTKYE